MTEKVFTVEGMKCGQCEANVEKALMAIDGVAMAKADRENDCVVVEYDESKASPSDFKNAVENLGRFEFSDNR